LVFINAPEVVFKTEVETELDAIEAITVGNFFYTRSAGEPKQILAANQMRR
jgi:hypothetical protein